MINTIKNITEAIRAADAIHIVTHIDADGITAGAIAKLTLERAGIETSIEFVKQLTESTLTKISDRNQLTWFTDLGSGMVSHLSTLGVKYIITDHHIPERETRQHLPTYDPRHLNPHLYGIDGSRQISGAGITYLVARAFGTKNRDLAALAIVGATGDFQDTYTCRLEGLNREILQDGKAAGVLEWRQDIRFFGRSTRPISYLLQPADDPFLPGLTGEKPACFSFLHELGIPVKDKEAWRRWIDLTEHEKKKIVSSIIRLLLSQGFGHRLASRVIGEVYTLTQEEQGSELGDTKEFATLLNSTGRHEKALVGLQICMGDRGDSLREARGLLRSHRRHLAQGLHMVEEGGITEHEFIQFFHGGTAIKETIVGTITGILLQSDRVRKDLPLIGFAKTEDGTVKVSARATRQLLKKGINLSQALGTAAYALGGDGGGHDIAAGATIPIGTENEFLSLTEKEIRNQLTL